MDTDIKINEELMLDPLFPVHRIADRPLPYMKMLAQTFRLGASFSSGLMPTGNPMKKAMWICWW